MINTCQNCLHGEAHPFGITYIGNICSGCHTHVEKDDLDWDVQYEKLLNIISKFKSKNQASSVYDCVIPIKGVAEDYFVVEQILHLGLNPLLVAINDYFFNDIGWHNLHNLITVFDLDSQIYSPNIKDYRELVATAFESTRTFIPFSFSQCVLPRSRCN